MSSTEEKTWEEKAAAADGGKGLALEEYNPDNDADMNSLYGILLEENQKEDNSAAQKRLKRFIRQKRRDAAASTSDGRDKNLQHFTLDHLKGIKVDDTWEEQKKLGFDFQGRNDFVESVQQKINDGSLLSPPSSPQEEAPHTASTDAGAGTLQMPDDHDDSGGEEDDDDEEDSFGGFTLMPPPTNQWNPPDVKTATAFVYSSVSGTGKTVSMLVLKEKLKDDKKRTIVVAYLGFNSCLKLTEAERWHIIQFGTFGAEQVLARRLAASTIISKLNPSVVTILPKAERVYKDFVIPNVEYSKKILLEGTGATKDNPLYVVAGLDEVQMLNETTLEDPQEKTKRLGLGKYFLRVLREWQAEWYSLGIRLLPLGTGISLDWAANPTVGFNLPLHGGEDTTLISKPDFKIIVQKLVDWLNQRGNQSLLTRLVGRSNPDMETLVDLMSASYWPRLRLLEFIKRDRLDLLEQRNQDTNSENWLVWFCRWLQDGSFVVDAPEDRELAPRGQEGKIHTLFQLTAGPLKFSVIPDGYTSSSLVENLNRGLPVDGLYDGLNVIKTMLPTSFLPDATDFEALGFHTLGAAIHVGLYALKTWKNRPAEMTPTHKKRLGVAHWFISQQAKTHDTTEAILAPRIRGPTSTLSGDVGALFPFSTQDQDEFSASISQALLECKEDKRPLYVRGGKQAKCDYYYFYWELTSVNGLICMLGDAKHTESGSNNIGATYQEQLFTALVCVQRAISAMNKDSTSAEQLVLKAVRLVFVSNKTALSTSNTMALVQAKQAAERVLPGVYLEVLNKENFQFGTFSDILGSQRANKAKAPTKAPAKPPAKGPPVKRKKAPLAKPTRKRGRNSKPARKTQPQKRTLLDDSDSSDDDNVPIAKLKKKYR